jgi:hypothetical protein
MGKAGAPHQLPAVAARIAVNNTTNIECVQLLAEAL